MSEADASGGGAGEDGIGGVHRAGKAPRRWLVPEIVQTSAMDCGPAALACLLGGFGVHVSYGRMREACQTDVDGTSIDTLEDVARQLGLEAEQLMLPLDHILMAGRESLPAIVVVRLPSGFTHFVVAWRRHGPFVQVMDPAIGRRWVRGSQLLRETYVHTTTVPADAFREWASSNAFREPLGQRLAAIRCQDVGAALVAAAVAASGWKDLATVDAATRMVTTLVRAGGVSKGEEAARVLTSLVGRALAGDDVVPASYWTARPAPAGEDGDEQVLLRGAVLVHTPKRRTAPSEHAEPGPTGAPREEEGPRALSEELALALHETPDRPARALLALLHGDGAIAPLALGLALVAAVFGAAVEATLFRALFDVNQRLALPPQRVVALGAVVLFASALLALELPLQGGLQRLGRRLEIRLRVAFLSKLPNLADRYFQSRPTSDMAERAHAIQSVRTLPALAGQVTRVALELVVTTGCLVWLDPRSAPLAIAVAGLALALPLAFLPTLSERDLRARNHHGALSRFYLDALRGLSAIRSHGAERSVRREHESLLVDWAQASRGLLRAAVAAETVQLVTVYCVTISLVLRYLARASEPAAVLLLLYWALNLPALGQELGALVRQYPAQRNAVLRLLEPLGTREESTADGADAPSTSSTLGVALAFEGVKIVAAGHTILEDVDLSIPAGMHVAIVGVSGAGKSSLIGALLGWHRPSLGSIRVDGAPLDVERMRSDCAWVDPAVDLWNRSLLDNLRYGVLGTPESLAPVLSAADLRGLLESLPDGLGTTLGEGGGLVSGGEGQRVRFGRALLRRSARIAILDEPFRGLDREKRRRLLTRARGWWKEATLLCVTHDVGETRSFPRVIVIEGGRVVEDGAPSELAGRADSRYRAMLDAEDAVRNGLWNGADWKRFRLEQGVLTERTAANREAEQQELTPDHAPKESVS